MRFLEVTRLFSGFLDWVNVGQDVVNVVLLARVDDGLAVVLLIGILWMMMSTMT